jgi:HD-GYP domain-containing protein (c-di-GMP phosphodiesterase class II)
MLSTLIAFFNPPEYDSFELTQKAKFLHFTLLILSAACILLGFQNLSGETILDTVLFIVGFVCFLSVPLNKLGYYTQIAIFISALLLVLITFSLIDGVGLKDAGLMAYPIFIIFTSFVFNKKASLIAILLSIISVVFIFNLAQAGKLDPPEFSNNSQLVVIIILIVATGFFLWVVMGNFERVMKNLRDTYDLTLTGWSKTLEFRDQETEGHSRRVTEITLDLAKRLGITGRELDHIHRGATLHDIGKMAIPDAILLKKGKLTDAEWDVVKQHPIHSKRLLEDIPYLKPALDIPYSHHERWDGSGYPDGLSGEAIPLAARVFAVVDVWDALISDRPYRKGWPKDKALAYIQKQSGKQFDPKVVEAFLYLLNSDKYKDRDWSPK